VVDVQIRDKTFSEIGRKLFVGSICSYLGISPLLPLLVRIPLHLGISKSAEHNKTKISHDSHEDFESRHGMCAVGRHYLI
jgi:hypothetical protein